MVRGQFRGYRDEPGVAPDSSVATYAALRLHVDSWRWEGCRSTSGPASACPTTCTEVIVELATPPQVVFAEATPKWELRALPAEPEGGDRARRRAKRPGEGMAGEPVELSVFEQAGAGSGRRMGDYERLLGDAMAGDATLFARQDVVEAAWAIVDPVHPRPSPMYEYEPGTWGPPQADGLVSEIGGWNTPQ